MFIYLELSRVYIDWEWSVNDAPDINGVFLVSPRVVGDDGVVLPDIEITAYLTPAEKEQVRESILDELKLRADRHEAMKEDAADARREAMREDD